jgi:uncharacterized protein (TIGR02001 family)
VRLRAGGLALFVALVLGSAPCAAADEWAGSLGLTSDYFVRGISRTSNEPALQLDLHYYNGNGFLAGVFASNSQINSSEPKDVELSGYIGFAWNLSADWRSKLLASHYAYPWNRAGAQYNYNEVDLDIAYQGWLHFSLDYSPNSPRFVPHPYAGLISVDEKSMEMTVQRPIVGEFSATAGLGYSFLDGPESGGYLYWSVGAAYGLKSVSLVLAYVDTTAEAKALFYNAAAGGRWTGTVIWRF